MWVKITYNHSWKKYTEGNVTGNKILTVGMNNKDKWVSR